MLGIDKLLQLQLSLFQEQEYILQILQVQVQFACQVPGSIWVTYIPQKSENLWVTVGGFAAGFVYGLVPAVQSRPVETKQAASNQSFDFDEFPCTLR